MISFKACFAFLAGVALTCAANTEAAGPNLVDNGPLERAKDNAPVGFRLTGSAMYGDLGDARRDIVSRGVWLYADRPAGEVSCTVTGLMTAPSPRPGDPHAGRWFRFTVRGLPQANFAVNQDDLYLKVSFFGDRGKTDFDAKARKIYDQIETARKDLAVNGNHNERGAEVWRTYQLDFCLPFPQVDTVTLAVGFGHGAAKGDRQTAFLVDDFSLVAIPDPVNAPTPNQPSPVAAAGKLLPIGGRWFYAAGPGETAVPKTFDAGNVDRLLYRDAVYSAPFAGNVSAWLRPGNMDAAGQVVKVDRLVKDNVTITFDKTSMIVRTKGIPNHPTGRFPEQGFGNPSYIEEQNSTFYFPLVPKENAWKRVIDGGNQNGALHMGPIGLAVNGVVFFNPFDMGSEDASNMMDRCCGHPNPDGQYHYHKYPICVNSPWADEGKTHSPLLGWAFDGVPVYGPYESAGVMAKDVKGPRALDGQNGHYDAERGWHYHVTPGKFPYLIGGFWGVEDERNQPRRGPGRRGPR